MKLTNVRLILGREIRDQLRDRRTLFMIFVLPVLLYPLLGTTLSQMVQFRRERPTSVLVVGAGNLTKPPCLFENGVFSSRLASEKDTNLLELTFEPEPAGKAAAADPKEEAGRKVESGQFDAALYFAPDFEQRLEAFRQVVRDQGRRSAPRAEGSDVALQVPLPAVFCNKTKERSIIASARLGDVLDRWADEVGRADLTAAGIPVTAARPFSAEMVNVAGDKSFDGSAIWSKLLPVMLLIWALTGAFYPAVDLCAGEKERGTLETLLSSPAERSEIAVGKLLTIMVFSMITSALNLVSVGATGWLIFGRLAEFTAPPPLAIVWLGLALVPVSALFSALCLALAAFARSTKEGQYYLMPLLLVTLPLAIMPLMPSVELTPGNSLVPITNIVLLLRSLLQGEYWKALEYLPIVMGVTLIGCWLAVRWAVEQFNSEEVLFRESERFGMRLWVRHLVRDRKPTPTVAAALFCGVLILLCRFVMSGFAESPTDFAAFARSTLVLQLAGILVPALIMTFMLTSRPRQTLLLRLPAWRTIPAAVALALAFHPVAAALRAGVFWLYPFDEEIGKKLGSYDQIIGSASLWQLVLVLAIAPAICEELAFRGFILSGLRNLRGKWSAIFLSAVLFGVAHAILHQWIITFAIGLVIAYVAFQTRSLLPGIVFHVLHNTLMLASARIAPDACDKWPALRAIMSGRGDLPYTWQFVGVGAAVTLVLLAWFTWRSEGNTPEEDLQEAFERTAKRRVRVEF